MIGTQGFGYDPLFYYPPLGIRFAEMSPEEKNKVSHRGQGACTAYLDVNFDDSCGLLVRFELKGESPSGTSRFFAQPGLDVKLVDLDDGPIDFVWKLRPHILKLMAVVYDIINPIAYPDIGSVNPKAPPLKGDHQFILGLRFWAADIPDAIAEHIQRSLCGDPGIKLSKGACCCIPGVGKAWETPFDPGSV